MTIPGPPTLQQVANDVFAYIQPNGGWCLSNAGLVRGAGGSALIDTAATEIRARRLRGEVARVIPAGPDLLVNTHHHGDHVFGNALFSPPATIVGHERMREEMIESGTGLRQLFPDVDWGETRLAPPTLTFRDTITIHAGDIRLELIHVGPAHTTNDVVVWLPEREVLFTGDVVMNGATPFCLMGSIEGSLRAIDRLRGLGARTIVTGHGPVSGPEVFDVTESYLRWVQRLTEETVPEGRSPLDAARSADLGEFADLLDTERLVGNLHRARAEYDGRPLGEPIDVLTGFQEMVAYNGGRPACFA